jgi:hypothetical protein
MVPKGCVSMNQIQDYKKFISRISESNWKIVYDKYKLDAKVINEKDEEMDLDALEFILGELGDLVEKKREEVYGEPFKQPIDELNQKKMGIKNYTVIDDSVQEGSREVFETFYNKSGAFVMNRYAVDLEKNIKYGNSGFSVCLNVEEATKLIKPLDAYIAQFSKRFDR